MEIVLRFNGSYGPDSAAYSTQIDDGPIRVMNAPGRLNHTAYQQLLFTADSLDPCTSHNITLTILSRGKLAVDYAKVYATRDPTGDSDPSKLRHVFLVVHVLGTLTEDRLACVEEAISKARTMLCVVAFVIAAYVCWRRSFLRGTCEFQTVVFVSCN